LVADMASVSFDEFAEFVREWGAIPRKIAISPETRFEDDLGITGDDGCELLTASEAQFNIRLSSEEHGYRDTFRLGTNEFLFHSEGFGPSLLDVSRTIRAFTVGELYNAVQEALRESR
jgi:acyl carrier protein